MLNPHLVQVVAVSEFFVPQFGQNKSASRGRGVNPADEPKTASYTRYTQAALFLKGCVCAFVLLDAGLRPACEFARVTRRGAFGPGCGF